MSTYDIAIPSWTYKKHTALLAISIDDILMDTSHRSLYDSIKQYFDGRFNYTTSEGNIICYINIRIIVSPYGINWDITDHIIKNVLQDYWGSTKAPYQQSPFPFKNIFEFELFIAPPLVGKDLKDIEFRHNGSLYKWTSFLQYIVQISRIDIGYTVMRLSSYMTALNNPIFDALCHYMDFLYHHPHRSIKYPRKPFHPS
eukprot:6250448-Ditylum_brightwellii.AAC.1